jgi:3-hydroxyisobutyrate dehydrogenase-like beta-hydroxyacid dehydrogenase
VTAEQTIAILHPGEMGAAIGARLRAKGLRVLWVSAGRGAATRDRARRADLEDAGTLSEALSASAIVLSVCPPHSALSLAREVAAARYRGIYIDANAVAPATVRTAAVAIEAGGGTFVDGGIIGPPPRDGTGARLYLSGSDAAHLAPLLSSGELIARALEGPLGAASALKAAFAAWNKGATALASAARALAAHAGVGDELVKEWQASQPDALKRIEQMRGAARKAWRWTGEMEEIAAAFAEAGLPDGFHLAARDVYERLASFKDAGTAPSTEAILVALRPNKD